MGALATPELTAKSLAMVGGVFEYVAAVYLHQNTPKPAPDMPVSPEAPDKLPA